VGDNLLMYLVGPEDFGEFSHGPGEAILLLVCYALGLYLIALGIFRRREMA
jgi:hypothetical protein